MQSLHILSDNIMQYACIYNILYSYNNGNSLKTPNFVYRMVYIQWEAMKRAEMSKLI